MRVRWLLNSREAETDRQLTAVAARHAARVFAKVWMADVLALDDRTESSAVSFAMRAHFDFVVTDSSNRPLFAVKFDGPLHGTATQAARDAQKDVLCGDCAFPILRTKATH